MNGTQQTETPALNVQARKVYRRPQLVEYGRVSELTQGGFVPESTEGGPLGIYYVSS